MADTKVSGLPAVSSVVSGAEFPCNDVGTSRKATAAQMQLFMGVQKVRLSSDLTNATTTLTKVTGLDTTMGVGTWDFRYMIRYQSDTVTTGIKFSVNHTGTTTSAVVNAMFQENTTLAVTGAADQTQVTFGLVSGGAARAVSTTVDVVKTTSVDTTNSDMLMVIYGSIVVTVSGNIELYHGSEAATTTTVKQDSYLILNQIA